MEHEKAPGLSGLIKLGQAETPQRVAPPRQPISRRRVAIGAAAALGCGLLFRFPLPFMLLLAVLGGLVVWAASRWPRSAPGGATAFAAAFLAQATSIFVTPFTWWLRFAFFGTLVGSYLALIVWQTREL